MMAIAMSPAALGLLRALTLKAGVARDRILLTEWRSVDWQSLTFVGERHEIQLRIAGPGSGTIALTLTEGLGEVEFSIPGHTVADIAVVAPSEESDDGSTLLRIEALTIAE